MTAPTPGFAPLTPPAASRPAEQQPASFGPYADRFEAHSTLLPDSSVFVNEFTRPVPDPAVVFSGPGYLTPRAPRCAFSISALVCALVGVLLVVPAVIAIPLGHVGLRRTRGHQRTGHSMAIGGLILGYAVSFFWAVVLGVLYFG